MAQQIQAGISVNASELKTVICQCGKSLFDQVSEYKILPAVYSQTGKPALIARPCLRCIACGTVCSIDEYVA